mgnify:CR=1 FL=1
MAKEGKPKRPSAAERAREQIKAKTVAAPLRPGVYMFKDARGKVIYIGKAKSLRARLRSYLRHGDGRYQLRFLLDRARDVETLVTASETEALMLENNLIKQHKPRYNIKLKDDKSYLSVKITTKDPWPRILVTRKITRDGNTYLGPFPSASGLRRTVDTVRKVFPLRTCSDGVFRNRSRPCLEYQIKRCMAPCVLEVDRAEYERHLDGATKLLEGKTESLLSDLEDRMREASGSERFEEAARVRDRMAAVRQAVEGQKVVVHGGGDRDVFGACREAGYMEVAVLMVRAGKLVSHSSYHFEDLELPDDELLSSLLGRFYEGGRFVPDQVLLPFAVEGMEALAEYLSAKRNHPRRVKVMVPQRGDKRALVDMARDNAVHAMSERGDEGRRREAMLEELGKKLGLTSSPKRIECFDISHVSGEAVVASMVAFDEAVADKDGYRRYRLRGVQRNDDFAAMKEVLDRRLKRGKAEGGLPDLIVVDGGKGQLGVAVEAMRELGVEEVEVCALAKERVRGPASSKEVERIEDRVFRPGRSNAITFRRNSPALFLLQQVRDEAHRFAITFHRSLRSKARLRSGLDEVAGVGPARRKALLSRFGSLERIRRASQPELAETPGVSAELARRILAELGT